MRTATGAADEAALRDTVKKIESALADLFAAESKTKIVAERISQLERDLAAKFCSFDPLEDSGVAVVADMRARLGVLQIWLANSHPLRQAIEKLCAILLNTKSLVERTSQERCQEEATIAQTYWNSKLLTLGTAPLDSQVRGLREVAQNVLTDLSILLEKKRGARLTAEEIRSGVLRSGAVAVRKLEPAERQSGVADV